MKYAFSIIYTFLFFSFTTAQTVENHSVNFEFDKAELSVETKMTLDLIQKNALEAFKYEIEIIGHTDQDGDYAYNNILAQKRANSVYDYLIEQGVSPTHTTHLSKGEYDLLYANSDDISKAKNRRVEIITKIHKIENIEELISMFSPESQEQSFVIMPDKGQILTGKSGTEVEIPIDAFVFEDGSRPKGPVSVQLTEAFDYNAFMNHNLSCMSEERLLESGGMIKLTAQSEGKELKMKEGKEVKLTFPESEIKEDMELFYGMEHEEGVDNWTETSTPISQKIEIDPSIIEQIDLKALVVEPIKPKMPEFQMEKIPTKPKLPNKPYKPYKPKEPKKENIKINFSFKEKLMLSQEDKQKRIDEAYEKKVEKYNKDLAKYEEKLAIYEENIANFGQTLLAAKQRVKRWEEEIEKCRKEIGHYYYKMEVYRNEKMIEIAQEYLIKNLDNEDKNSVLLKYDELLHRQDITYQNALANRNFQRLFDLKEYSKVTSYKTNYRIVDDKMEVIDESFQKRDDRNRIIIAAPAASISEVTFNMKENKTVGDLGRYATSVSALGWINCDRFIDVSPMDMRQIVLQSDENTNYYMAFKDINSMLKPRRKEDITSFVGVPKGEVVRIVGIRLVNNEPSIFYREMTIEENEEMAPQFVAASFDEIKSVFARLGS